MIPLPFSIEIILPQAFHLVRQVDLFNKHAYFFPIELGDILGPAMGQDLLNIPFPLPGVFQINFILRPNNIPLGTHAPFPFVMVPHLPSHRPHLHSRSHVNSPGDGARRLRYREALSVIREIHPTIFLVFSILFCL